MKTSKKTIITQKPKTDQQNNDKDRKKKQPKKHCTITKDWGTTTPLLTASPLHLFINSLLSVKRDG